MCTNVRCFVASVTLLIFLTACSNHIRVDLRKTSSDSWSADFVAARAVSKFGFQRNPDDSRTKRWAPKNPNFEVVYEGGKEFLKRKDNKKFRKVSILLTPTYKQFSKDYAPFAPYTDGGMLLHSGRFFACVNSCDQSPNHWEISLSIPDEDHMLVDGKQYSRRHSWVDKNSGRKVYVGRQKPRNAHGFLYIVDVGLPKVIDASLNKNIPKLVQYFENKLGQISEQHPPTLFASYSNTGKSSGQSGVLPGQIFTHWDSSVWNRFDSTDEFLNQFLWTLAHEVGHYFQQSHLQNIDSNESWIHEGHAEMLAYKALEHLYPNADSFREAKATEFKTRCIAELEKTSLEDAADKGEFGIYYSCGFLVYQMIENATKGSDRGSDSAFLIWKLFKEKNTNPKATARQNFIEAVKKMTDEETEVALENFIKAEYGSPNARVQELLKMTGLK